MMSEENPEQEGTIKYELEFYPGAPINNDSFKELNAWRRVFYKMNLIGQDKNRYDGLGYGNISCRFIDDKNPKRANAFLVSGSQTAHLNKLSPSHYSLVRKCSVINNSVVAVGPIKPSSESLTHGAVYQGDAEINAVVHVHSPEIWNNVVRLKLPFTDKSIHYGTPDMAKKIQQLISQAKEKSGVIVMKGHEDGVISYGRSIEEASIKLISLFQKALIHWV